MCLANCEFDSPRKYSIREGDEPGSEFSLRDLLAQTEFADAEIVLICQMRVGNEYNFGGGAMADIFVKRVA